MRRSGLLDLQVNGYAGHDVNADDVTADDVVALTKALWAVGTSRYLPTVITGSEERMLRSMAAVAEARRSDPTIAAAIPGIHVEGPHISDAPGACGAHDVEVMCDPDPALLDRWLEASEGLIRIVTLAPERAGTTEYVAHATERRVRVSIGHCDAAPDDVRRAVEAGATLSTHLGNGIPATIPRHPNQIWSQLAADDLIAMFILDGHHLPAEAATAMIRAKSLERTLLVSDAAALAGSAPGIYETPVGGRVEVTDDGALRLPGSPLLAGSGANLLGCLRWGSEHLPFALDELWARASAAPAELLELDTSGDHLELDGWDVVEVAVDGEVVHRA